VPTGDQFSWDETSTYVKHPPYFVDMTPQPAPVRDIRGARVLAVADAWDAMTSHRAYRQALPLERVYAELERGRGAQFDPAVLDAFLHVLRERPDLAAAHTTEAQDTDETEPQAPRAPEHAA